MKHYRPGKMPIRELEKFERDLIDAEIALNQADKIAHSADVQLGIIVNRMRSWEMTHDELERVGERIVTAVHNARYKETGRERLDPFNFLIELYDYAVLVIREHL